MVKVTGDVITIRTDGMVEERFCGAKRARVGVNYATRNSYSYVMVSDFTTR